MPSKDKFHNVVKKALEKENWKITHDPFSIRIDGIIDMYIDLGAEKVIAAEKNRQKIAVEIKSFLGNSAIYEFHLAIGQYINYRYALQEIEPERQLYLAVSVNIYQDFFQRNFIQNILKQNQINLIIYDLEKEEINQWKN